MHAMCMLLAAMKLHVVLQEAARLSPEQQQRLAEAHAGLCLSLSQLAEERDPLTAILHSSMPMAFSQAQSLLGISKVTAAHILVELASDWFKCRWLGTSRACKQGLTALYNTRTSSRGERIHVSLEPFGHNDVV